MDLLQQAGYTTSDDEGREELETKVTRKTVTDGLNSNKRGKEITLKNSKKSLSQDVSNKNKIARTATISKRLTKANTNKAKDDKISIVIGNWVGHVFASIEDKPIQSFLLHRANELLPEDPKEKIILHSKRDLHISLSKPFNITLPNVDGFISSLRQRIQSSSLLPIKLIVDTSKLNTLVNEDNSKLFYTFPIINNDSMVLKWIIRNIDYTMDQFHLPIYYENPIFHVSVASSSLEDDGNDNCSMKSVVQDDSNDDNILGSEEEENTSCCSSESFDSENYDIPIIITRIHCTFGGGSNKMKYFINLS